MNKKLFGMIGLGCASAGFLLSFIMTFVACNLSAEKITDSSKFSGSYAFIGVLIGAIIAIAGGVFAFLSREAGTGVWNGFDLFALISFALVVVTLIFTTFPHITICAYNNAIEDSMKSMFSLYRY